MLKVANINKQSIKDEILKLIPETLRGEIVGNELFFICPNPKHDDTNPTNCSINLKTGIFYCFACGFSGNLSKLKKLLKNTNNYAKNPFVTTNTNKRSCPW